MSECDGSFDRLPHCYHPPRPADDGAQRWIFTGEAEAFLERVGKQSKRSRLKLLGLARRAESHGLRLEDNDAYSTEGFKEPVGDHIPDRDVPPDGRPWLGELVVTLSSSEGYRLYFGDVANCAGEPHYRMIAGGGSIKTARSTSRQQTDAIGRTMVSVAGYCRATSVPFRLRDDYSYVPSQTKEV